MCRLVWVVVGALVGCSGEVRRDRSGPPEDGADAQVGADLGPAGDSDPAIADPDAAADADADAAGDSLTGADATNAGDADPAAGDDDLLAALSDEFDDPTTQAGFTELHSELRDSVTIADGRLTFLPAQQLHVGWYADIEGPLLLKQVTGNFVVETYANACRRSDRTLPPRGVFNEAGYIIRDPASTSPNNQRWMLFNVGFQNGFLGRQVKSTRPGPTASRSTLLMNPSSAGVHTAALRVCRVGDTFYFLHRHDGEVAWSEEPYDANTALLDPDGAGLPAGVSFGEPIRFVRPDLPATLDVGLMGANWEAPAALPYEGRAEFEYLRFARVTEFADCIADF